MFPLSVTPPPPHISTPNTANRLPDALPILFAHLGPSALNSLSQDWHGIFLRFDRDSSGLIDRKELHQALLGFGFSLPPEMVKRLEKRFAPPPKPGASSVRSGGISFDRFLMACVTVKHYTEAFRRADKRGDGRLTLDYNQFMDMMLDAP